MTEITQADREAAAKLLGGAMPDGLLEGRQDSLSLVQAFARHRIAAHAEGFAQGYAAAKAQAVGVAEAEKLPDHIPGDLGNELWDVGHYDACESIAQAIAAMEPGA